MAVPRSPSPQTPQAPQAKPTPANGRKVVRELFGLTLLFWGLFVLLTLMTHSQTDPGINHVVSSVVPVKNSGGMFGAYVSGLLVDLFGFASFVWPLVFLAWGAGCVSTWFTMPWWRWFGFLVLGACFITFGAALNFGVGDVRGGGMLGASLYAWGKLNLSPAGAGLVWLFMLFISMELAFSISWMTIINSGWGFAKAKAEEHDITLATISDKIGETLKRYDPRNKREEPVIALLDITVDDSRPSDVPPGSYADVVGQELAALQATQEAAVQEAARKAAQEAAEKAAQQAAHAVMVNLAPTAPPLTSPPATPDEPRSALAEAFANDPLHQYLAAIAAQSHKSQSADPAQAPVENTEPAPAIQPEGTIPDGFIGQARPVNLSKPVDLSKPAPKTPSSATPASGKATNVPQASPLQLKAAEQSGGFVSGILGSVRGFFKSGEPDTPLPTPVSTPAPVVSGEPSIFDLAGLDLPQQGAAPKPLTTPTGERSLAKPIQPVVAKPVPAAPAPVPPPAPIAPAPVVPTPVPPVPDPVVPVQPAPVQPAPVQAMPVQPAPAQAQPAALRPQIVPPVSAQPVALTPPWAEAPLSLPPLSLLQTPTSSDRLPDVDTMTAKGGLLLECLATFNIRVDLVRITPGPVVTMFEIKPAPGTKVARILGLHQDLALALKALSVRVHHIPGHDTLSVEIPNESRATVNFRKILESPPFQSAESLLSLALGVDTGGTAVVADLAKMPHLLVGGATGAGKSVCINSLLVSLLCKATPDELKLLMVDPKVVELAMYADLPHLIHPVVTETQLAKNALEWAVHEMEQRYIKLAAGGVRNIAGYNQRVKAGELPPELQEAGPMPYLVIVVDELADLMLSAGKDVETAIVRLAQLARACGIHLIIATQRPSVDVVTGLIKANFPSRIAFQVTSAHDSRTILDTIGAELLLGRGDMLFKPSGSKPRRLHGPFVSDEDVQAIVDFWKSQRTAEYAVDFSEWGAPTAEAPVSTAEAAASGEEALYAQIIDFALKEGKSLSISKIQRRFRIGFNKAARFMERMEEDGIVQSAGHANRARDVL